MAGSRNHYERAFAGWLTETGLAALAVDERHRPVIGSRRLKNFDFVINGCRQVYALDLKGRRASPWITADDLFSMMAWRGLLAGAIEPAFLFGFFHPAAKPAGRLADLSAMVLVKPSGTYRFCVLGLDDTQRLARPRSARWNTYGFEWAAFARHARAVDALLVNQADQAATATLAAGR